MNHNAGIKSISRRQFVCSAALGLPAVMIAACSPTPAPAPAATAAPQVSQPTAAATTVPAIVKPTVAPTAAPAKPVTVKVLFQYATSEGRDGMMKTLDEFTRRNPSIKLDVQGVSEDDVAEVLQTRAAANDMPHVSYQVTSRIANYVLAGMTQDIGEFVPKSVRDLYGPTSMVEVTLDGGLYGLPEGYTVRTVAYNATYFEKAGIKPALTEADVWTWDRLVENAKLLQAKAGAKYGLQFEKPSFDGWIPTLYQNGGSVGGPKFDQPTLAEKPSVEAMEWAYKLHKDGIAAPGVIEGTEQGLKLFTSGISAIWVNTHNEMIPALDSQMKNYEWGFMLTPKKVQNATLAGGASWIAYKNSEPHVKETAELIMYLASPEVVNAGLSAAGGMVALKDISGLKWALRPDLMPVVAEQARVGFNELVQLTVTNPTYGSVRDRLLRELQMVVSGQKTAQEGGTAMAQQFMAAVEEQKKKR